MDHIDKWHAFNSFAEYISYNNKIATVTDSFEDDFDFDYDSDLDDPDSYNGWWNFDMGEVYAFRVYYKQGRFLLNTEDAPFDSSFRVSFRDEEPSQRVIDVFKIMALTVACVRDLNNTKGP